MELVLYAMSHGENRRGGMDAEQRLSAEEEADGYNGDMQKGEEIAR